MIFFGNSKETITNTSMEQSDIKIDIPDSDGKGGIATSVQAMWFVTVQCWIVIDWENSSSALSLLMVYKRPYRGNTVIRLCVILCIFRSDKELNM